MADEKDTQNRFPDDAGQDPHPPAETAGTADKFAAVLAELRTEVHASKEETDKLGVDTGRLERSTARLIEEVAEGLASTREVAGLPPKDAREFRELIERRRAVG